MGAMYSEELKNREMMTRFEQEVELLTRRTTPMGVKEILMDRAKNEGKAIGRHEEALEIALQMLADNFPIEQIVKYTKLSTEEVQALKK